MIFRLPKWTTLVLALVWPATAQADVTEVCARAAEKGYELRQSGSLVEALSSFGQCARDECPAILRKDCREALAEIRNQAPRLIVRVRTRSAIDVLDAEVEVDGLSVSAVERANGHVVNPGPHVVRVRRGGVIAAEQTVMATVAERLRVVDFVVDVPNIPPPAPPPASQAASPDHERASLAPDRRTAFAAGAVGLSFLAGFAVLGTWSFVEHRSLESSCGVDCFRPEAEVAHARAIVADAALGAAIVSLGVATVLWITAGAPPSRAAQRKASGSSP